ncbi:MAG TPA: hypothetical protein VJ799_13905 [Nitrososphaeraceae archaeon]|nr:hypothetical protein [Nitrososphaeraceae archaeon]
MNQNSKKFNIIGWGYENVQEYKHCPLDSGVRLIKVKGEWKCPQCGYTYQQEEASNEQEIQPQHKKQQTSIISAKGKKKHYSDNGEEIKDSDLINEHVTYYQEELPK